MVRTLQDFVKATVAPYKYPRSVVFVAQLPRTQTGKLQRFVLKQAAQAVDSAQAAPAAPPVSAPQTGIAP
jgi:2-aminobenzoate-CoA ligase